MHDANVVVIGAGAAGVAAARRLVDAQIRVVVIEARDRVGGRGWTRNIGGFPLDLGCGWLHSADKNEWSRVAQSLGFEIDPTPATRRNSGLRAAVSTGGSKPPRPRASIDPPRSCCSPGSAGIAFSTP